MPSRIDVSDDERVFSDDDDEFFAVLCAKRAAPQLELAKQSSAAAVATEQRGAAEQRSSFSESDASDDEYSEDDASSDYDARAELALTYTMLDDMDKNDSEEQAVLDAMEKNNDGWIAVQNAADHDKDAWEHAEDAYSVALESGAAGQITRALNVMLGMDPTEAYCRAKRLCDAAFSAAQHAADDDQLLAVGRAYDEIGIVKTQLKLPDQPLTDDEEAEEEDDDQPYQLGYDVRTLEDPPTALYHAASTKRPAPGGADEASPMKKSQFRLKARRPKPASDGSGAHPFIQGSEREVRKDVDGKRPTGTQRQEPDGRACVPYRTTAIKHNSTGEGQCVIEAFRAATGMTCYTRQSLGLRPHGDIDFKEVVAALRKDCSPFDLRTVEPTSWSGLLGLPKGIFLGRALLRDGNAHFVCYDSWRQILFIGGAPPPAQADAHDELEGVIRVDQPHKENENVGRSFYIEDSEIANPDLLQHYMRSTFAVVRSIDQLYSLHVQVNRAVETAYNTPEHYVEARVRRAVKLARKKKKEEQRHLPTAAAAEDATPFVAVPTVVVL